MSIYFAIPGKPMGKQRPRVTRTNTYTPQKTADYEDAVRWQYRIAARKQGFDGFADYPVKMRIVANMPIPQSRSKAVRAAMAKGDILPTVKPDWDNIGKIVCDALNGFAFKDDAQVAACTVEKRYSNTPCVEVWLEG